MNSEQEQLNRINALNPKAAYGLGMLMCAHANRQRQQKRAKESAEVLKSARSSVDSFGMYDDCGPSYLAAYDEAKGIHAFVVAEKISAQKFYKKCKMELLEAHPEVKEALEALIPGATSGIENEESEV